MSTELNGNPAIALTAQEQTARALALVETIKERFHTIFWHQAMLADADVGYDNYDEFIADFEEEFEKGWPGVAVNYFEALTRRNTPALGAALKRGDLFLSLN